MLAWKGGKRRRLESQDRPRWVRQPPCAVTTLRAPRKGNASRGHPCRFPKTPGGSHEKTHVVIEERPSAKEEPGAKEEPAKAVAHERAASRLATSAYEEMLVESCRCDIPHLTDIYHAWSPLGCVSTHPRVHASAALFHERGDDEIIAPTLSRPMRRSRRPELHQSARSAGGGKTAKPGPWGAQKLSHRGGQGSGVSLDLQRLDMDKRERAMRRAAESAAGGDAEGSGQ